MTTLALVSFWLGVVAACIATSLQWWAFTVRLPLDRRVPAVAGQPHLGTFNAGVPLGGFVRVGGSRGSLARFLSRGVLILLLVTLASRSVAAGRMPLADLWEFTVAFALAVGAFQVVSERRHGWEASGALLQPIVLALLILAAALPSRIEPIAPVLRNPSILAAHVGVMVAAYGVLSLSFAAAVGQLVQGRGRRIGMVPDAGTLDTLAWQAVVIGFPLLTLGIVLGAYWASSAWGHYWSWDPKETSALVTWLVYGLYFHLHSLRGWSGSRSAIVLIIAYGCLVFSYLAVNLWIAGLHSYAGA